MISIDIAKWLRELGLEEYEPGIPQNAIDARVLPRLTVKNLKDLGNTLVAHRRRLLNAFQAWGFA